MNRENYNNRSKDVIRKISFKKDAYNYLKDLNNNELHIGYIKAKYKANNKDHQSIFEICTGET